MVDIDFAIEDMKRTPLHDLHLELGARMVAFAGYALPLQYDLGVMKEHLHTREKAGLFDVSHMGQISLRGPNVSARLEELVPGDIQALAPGRMRYTFLTDAEGGVIDDMMVSKISETELLLVVNAVCKRTDMTFLQSWLPTIRVEYLGDDRGLLALQGPEAAAVVARFVPEAATMPFMSVMTTKFGGIPVTLTRSGYTGEDGFEIGMEGRFLDMAARLLLREPEVQPIGLAARDSLRLEAGLCLYGIDLTPDITPVEADLAWTIGKRRREETEEWEGAERIIKQLKEGVAKKRVGILPDGRAPARGGTEILDLEGRPIGTVTSGGYGPTLGAPIAMGYVETAHSAVGTKVFLVVRDKPLPARIAAMPFVPHRYYRGSR